MKLRGTLAWALGASTAVHASLVAVVALQAIHTPGHASSTAVVLQADLAPAHAAPVPVITVDARSPIALPAEPMMLMPLPSPLQRVALSRQPLAVPAPPVDGGFEDVRVAGAPLHDRARLGELYARQLGEFPREIDVPARVADKVFAQYPPEALAAGIEGSVAVWAVIDETGTATEIDVADGPPELSEAAIAAVRQGRFLPARNNLQPIRFPIALEFRFSAGERGARVLARAAG
jgi:TonB family protein